MLLRRALGLLPALFLVACSSINTTSRTVSLSIKGNVHGGQQPVTHSSVQLYAVGLSGGGSASTPLLTSPVFTDAGGTFSVTGAYTCPTADSQVYVLAQGGNPGLAPGTNNAAITLAAALGPCGNLASATFISLNEVTTVALASALAPFTSASDAIGSAPSDAVLLESAFAQAYRFASTTAGTSPGANLPAGVAIPVAEINSLANVLASCVNTAGGVAGDGSPCGSLFSLTSLAGVPAPTDTFAAAVRIADNPALNTPALFNAVTPISPFKPELTTAPPSFALREKLAGGLELSAPTLTFGSVNVGTAAPSQALTLTNSGTSPVALNSIVITGMSPSDFTVDNGCPASLAASASCTLHVGFQPSFSERRVAALAIANDTTENTLIVELSGAGIATPISAPTLTSVSPASLSVGSTSAVITLSGTGFTPLMTVTASGYIENYQYISPQAATLTLNGNLFFRAGGIPLTVRTRYGVSNTLSLPVTYPVPVLSAISPAVVLASAPSFMLTVTGTNFTSNSNILVNGVAQPTDQGSSPNALTTILQGAEIANPGSLQITVTNPAPGGGTSFAQTLQVVSTPNRFRTLKYAALDIVADPVREMLYAAEAAFAGSGANAILALDPVQGTVVNSVPLSSAPSRLAISDDGTFLYVAAQDGKITRLNLPSLTQDITFTVPVGMSMGDIQVAPGHPHTVAISVPGDGNSTRTVNIYDDAVARPLRPATSYAENSFDTLAWGPDVSTLFATNAVSSGGPEYIFSVDGSGPTLVNTFLATLDDFDKRLTYDRSTRRLYDVHGNVVDPATGTRVGRFSVQNTITYEANDVVVDSGANRAFFLNSNFFPMSTQGTDADIQSFNLTDFTHVSTLAVPGLSGSRIVRWGASGLAIAGGSQIFLVDGAFVGGIGPSVTAGPYAGISPTITELSTQAVAAGDGPVDVVITGRDFSAAAVATWNNHTLATTWQSTSQVTVTMPAMYLTTARSAPLSLTNGPGTEPSNTVAFAVLPDLGPNLHISALGVSGEEMVWDPTRSVLYVATTDPAAPHGNSVVTVDPAASVIKSALVTGALPYTLDASDDGKYLYVGFGGLQAVKRYKLDDFSLDLTIPLTQTPMNQNFADSVRVAPGLNQTFAVSTGTADLEPRDTGGVVIFDGSTARPQRSTVNMYGLCWSSDATLLVGTPDPVISSAGLTVDAVSSSGLGDPIASAGAPGPGRRPHFDTLTKLFYTDGGLIFNPTSRTTEGILISNGLMVPDGALNRAFVLHQTSDGAGYALDTFDLRRQTLLRSIDLPGLSGYPTQIVRWGADGLAILTDSPGLLYLLQGTDITGGSVQPVGSVVLNPAKLVVNTATGTTVMVTGAGFQPGSEVWVNGVQRATTFVSSTQLTFQVAAADQIVARDLSVSVSNLVGGGTSPDSTLEIDNPVPAISSLSTSMLSLASPDTTITVTGSGFIPSTLARLNGNPRTSTLISPTTLSVLVPSYDLAKLGALQLTLINAGPGGGATASVPIQVGNPQPVITFLSPASVPVGSAAQTVYIVGSGFNAATVVTVNGVAMPATLMGSAELGVSFPASTFASAASLAIAAVNPAPGGGTSPAMTLSVSNENPAPIQLKPSTVIQGASTPATIGVTGTNFIPSSVVLVSGQSRPTTYISSTQLTFRLVPADQATAGMRQVTVVNPVPGGNASSAQLTVAAASATPVISTVAPAQYIVDSGSQTMQVNGTGITPSTVILWNGTALQSSPDYAGHYVYATIPAELLTSPGTATITLSSPTATPSVSNAVNVSINGAALPALTSIRPLNGPVGTGFTVTLSGTGFTQDSVISVNGHPLQTTFADTSNLTASVPAVEVLFGNNVFTISTPQPGGGTSAPLVYTAYVPQVSNSMIYNAVNGLFYLSVPGSAGAPYGNSVVPLDPVTGALGSPIFVGSEPNHMAITADGHFLWVGLDGASAVRKVDLTSGTAGLQFSLASGTGRPATPATALAAIPGQPDSLIVSVSGMFAGTTAVFDNGVARPNTVPVAAQALVVDSSRAEVYSVGGQTYAVVGYSANGLTTKLSTTKPNLLAPMNDGHLQFANSRIYAESGTVLESETGTNLGNFPSSSYQFTTLTVDSALGLAFALDTNSYGLRPTHVDIFNLADFTPASTPALPVNYALTGSNQTLGTQLTRWSTNGLAFRTPTAIFALRSNLVKDISTSAADLSVTANVIGAGSTGTSTTYTAQVTNNGPTASTGVSLSASLPSAGNLVSVNPTAGTCIVAAVPTCNLGTLNSGASVTVSFVVSQLNPGTSSMTFVVSGSESDPNLANNRASASATITGNPVNPVPALASVAPSTILAGSGDTTVMLSGTGFIAGSVVMLDGAPLPTSVVSGTQISATVPPDSVASLGWHTFTVATPAPGGGTSNSLTLSVYSAINTGLSRITYDPFTRRIIGTLGPATPNGNSLEFIHPEDGKLETPIPIGSEPTRLVLSDDGQVLYVLLTASNRLLRFNMLSQQPEFSLNLIPSFPSDNSSNVEFAIAPGSENTVALSIPDFYRGEIADFNEATQSASLRPSTTGYNPAGSPQFLDATHLLVNGSSRIDDYTLTPNGLSPQDSSLSTFVSQPGALKIVGKQVFTSNGAVADFSRIPGTQLGSFPVSSGFPEGVVAVDPAVSRTFFLAGNTGSGVFQSYGPNGIVAFDDRSFLPSTFIPLGVGANVSAVDLLRWGQDGIAALTNDGILYLVRGPAVLPQLLQQGAAPTLAPPPAVQHGTQNTTVTITGANFQPGMAALWNGSYRTTIFLDAAHATVLLPASDVSNPGSFTLTVTNPGSQTSNAVTLIIN